MENFRCILTKSGVTATSGLGLCVNDVWSEGIYVTCRISAKISIGILNFHPKYVKKSDGRLEKTA
jgi:hypothetical protein